MFLLQNKIRGFIATISILEIREEMKDWHNIKEEIGATLKAQLRLFKSEIRKVIEISIKINLCETSINVNIYFYIIYTLYYIILLYYILYIISLKRFDNNKIMNNISSPH